MKIPKRFQLHGKTHTVRIIEAALWEDEESVAFFSPETAEISIKRQAPEMMEHAYLHELEHAILSAMNENKLFANERFVDVHAALLHQALTTAK